ncbi:MAG: Hsp20/alpha crystallin family protein [Flavobacteriaceae bacterium]|nr:Hsp20/alpha crystallin family protein [Flavobacteriaceae bacterium]
MLVKSTGIPVFPTLLDDFFRDWSTTNFSETNTTLPAVNIRENDDQFTVEVAVPGMEKEDFQIDLDNNILTISSEKKIENEETNDKYTRKEYSYQSFKRSFTLPKNVVDSDKIAATYKNGELVIAIPKKEEAKPKPARLIEVK